MSNTTLLIGTEPLSNAAASIRAAASEMQSVAARLEFAFDRRRQWEEEYLLRIEALVERELSFYSGKQ